VGEFIEITLTPEDAEDLLSHLPGPRELWEEVADAFLAAYHGRLAAAAPVVPAPRSEDTP
jgi:hypothetical protein